RLASAEASDPGDGLAVDDVLRGLRLARDDQAEPRRAAVRLHVRHRRLHARRAPAEAAARREAEALRLLRRRTAAEPAGCAAAEGAKAAGTAAARTGPAGDVARTCAGERPADREAPRRRRPCGRSREQRN